jgi:CubicO group peptidase (beta-lactamase class C family)
MVTLGLNQNTQSHNLRRSFDWRVAASQSPAINQLIENGSLSLDDKAQDILKMKQPNGTEPPTDPKPSDPNTQGHYFHAITVRNLLQHQIGWGDLPLPGAFDPMWNEEETQKAFNLPSQSLVTKY